MSPLRFIPWLSVIALLVLVSAAQAQQRRLDRRLYTGEQGLAWPRGVLALSANPAGLASATALEFQARAAWGGLAVGGDRGAGWGAWAGLPLGSLALAASLEQSADPAPAVVSTPGLGDFSRLSLGTGLRLDEWLDVGLAYRAHFGQAPQVGRLGTVDLGLLLSPWSWLSLGIRVSDLFGASSFALAEDTGAILGPHFAWGWAIKLRDEALIWSMDFEWPGSERLATLRGAVSLRLGEAWRVGLEFALFREPAVVSMMGVGDTRLGFTLSYRPSWWGMDVTVNRDHLPDQEAAGMMALGVSLRHEPTFGLVERLEALFNGAPLRARQGSHFGRYLHRRRLGWVSPLAGEGAVRAGALARGVLAWNNAMILENSTGLCRMLASGRLRFDVETHDPELVIHQSFDREDACASLDRGELHTFVFEFGPAQVHREPPLLLPQLFRIHGSAFFTLPATQERAYAEHLRRLRRGRKPLGCTIYRARLLRMIPAAEGRAVSRVYDVSWMCGEAGVYVLQLEGNLKLGFRVRKMFFAQ